MHSSTSFEGTDARVSHGARFTAVLRLTAAGALAGLVLTSCGGGSGSGESVPLDPPSALAYPVVQFDLRRDVQLPPLIPTYSGGSADFTVAPPLPSGLYMNAKTGAVSGIPLTATARTTYAVRAHNTGGEVTATFELEIHDDFDQPKFVYALHSDQSEISTWRYDAGTNSLVPTGRVATGSLPIRAEVDPLGRFLYVALAGQENIAVHRIVAETGELQPVQLFEADGATFDICFDPSGRFLYKSNLHVNTVQSYRIDQSNGFLIPVGASVSVPGPSGLTVSGDGTALFAGSIDGDAVLHFRVDEATGAIEQLLGAVGAGAPVDLVYDDATGRLYALDFLGSRLSTYLVSADTGRPQLLYETPTASGPASIVKVGNELHIACHSNPLVQRFVIDGPGGEPQLVGSVALEGRPTKLALLGPDRDALVALDNVATIAQVARASDGELTWTDRRTCEVAITDVVVVRGPRAFELATEAVFAATGQSLELAGYRAEESGLTPAGLPVPIALEPTALIVDSTHERLFVVESGSDQITTFDVDRSTLQLTRRTSVAAGLAPRDAALFPGSDNLVTIDTYGIALWSIDSAGELTLVDSDAIGSMPRHVAVDPSGRFAFVTAGTNLLVYAVDAFTGTLEHVALGGLTFAAGSIPAGLAVSPDGTTLVVALEGSRRLHVATLDAVTGHLTSASTLNTGLRSLDPTFDATGARLFTVEPEENLMSLFELTPSKTLSLLARADCGENSSAVAVDRSGDRAYGAAPDSDSIEVLGLGSAGTTLQPQTRVEVGAGSAPQVVATFAGWRVQP